MVDSPFPPAMGVVKRDSLSSAGWVGKTPAHNSVMKRDGIFHLLGGVSKSDPIKQNGGACSMISRGCPANGLPFLFCKGSPFRRLPAHLAARQKGRISNDTLPPDGEQNVQSFPRWVRPNRSPLFPAGGHCFGDTFPAEGKSALRSEPVKRRGRLRGSPQN